MLTSAVATDYNRVVCIRQTRNDEEVTDWWKWWAIIFLSKKKKKKKQQEKETTEYILKEKKTREREREKKSCCRMRAPWQLLGCTPASPLLPSPSLPPPPPPPSVREKKKEESVVWEREKEGDGMTAGWMVGDGWKRWRWSSGASVWCDVGGWGGWGVGIWCHAAAVCRTLKSPAASHLRPACCAWFDSFTMTLEIKI